MPPLVPATLPYHDNKPYEERRSGEYFYKYLKCSEYATYRGLIKHYFLEIQISKPLFEPVHHIPTSIRLADSVHNQDCRSTNNKQHTALFQLWILFFNRNRFLRKLKI